MRPDLDGKIHLTVGSADTFYLDQPARRLEALMHRLGAHADFTYVPGADHGSDIDAEGNGVVTDTRLYQLVRQAGQVRQRR